MAELGVNIETYTPPKLIAGSKKLVSNSVILLSGNNLQAGALLGKITVGAIPSTGTATPGNTGNGTLINVTGGPKTVAETITVTCVRAVTNAGDFIVTGSVTGFIGYARVGVNFSSPYVNFNLTDGTTDFAVGDSFTITIPQGSGKYTLSTASATDGSNRMENAAILAHNADASTGDKTVTVYLEGEFNSNAMTFGTGHTVSSVRDELRKVGIILKTP
jgi:hypothetical protein